MTPIEKIFSANQMLRSSSRRVTDVLHFYNNLNTISDDALLEGAEYIIGEPTKGPEFMLGVLARTYPDDYEFNRHINTVKEIKEEYLEAGNEDMANILENYMELAKAVVGSKEELSVTTESIINDLKASEIKKAPEEVSSVFIKPILGEMKYNDDKSHREVEDFYEEKHLNCCVGKLLLQVFPDVLTLVTKYIISEAGKEIIAIKTKKNRCDVPCYGRGDAGILMGLPLSLVTAMKKVNGITKNDLDSIAARLKQEIDTMLRDNSNKFTYTCDDGSIYTPYVIGDYINNLQNALSSVYRIMKDVKAIINDNVMTMQPQVGASEDTDKYEDKGEDIDEESLSTFETEFHNDEISTKESVNMLHSEADLADKITESILNFALAGENISESTLASMLNDVMTYCNYSSIQEANIITKASLGIQRGARKIQHSVKKGAIDSKRATAGITNASKSVNAQFNKTIDDIKAMDYNERREKIIQGGIRANLKRIIRVGIVSGIVAVGNPWYGAVALIGQFLADKRLDHRVKKELVDDIEDNLKMLDEKIEDAKSENDRKAKYQLMRQRDALEKEKNRIKYDLPNTQLRNAEVLSQKQ